MASTSVDRGRRRLSASSRASHWLLILIVMAIPGAVSLGLMMAVADGELLHYAPLWSDEVFNWHQVATFRVAGFGGGYYTVNEETAPLALSHFYTHGPVYPFLVGTLARVFGWGLYSGPLFNVALTTLALAVFIRAAKPCRAQLLLLGSILLTCWPLHLYMFTDMRLAFFYVFAILLAACFCRTIADPDQASRRFLMAFGALILLASLAKVTWSLLAVPYLLHIHRRVRVTPPQSLALSSAFVSLCFLAHIQLAAPYPSFAASLLEALHRSFAEASSLFFDHARIGLANFFDLGHRPLWLMLRAQTVACAVAAGVLIWRDGGEREASREGAVIVASCGLLIVLTILLYDVFDWRDFRLFAPPTFLASLLFIARRRFAFVGVLLAGNLLVLGDFVGAYETVVARGRFTADGAQRQIFADQLAPTLLFDDQADGWRNTILVPLEIAMDPRMVAIPAGIGISWFQSPADLQRVRSRYLLLDRQSHAWLSSRARLEFVRRTALGGLYINHGSEAGG